MRRASIRIQAITLLSALLAGCAEEQFYLRIKSQTAIEVTSPTEHVARRRAPDGAAHAQAFDDLGVHLDRDNYDLDYARDDNWISSLGPIRIHTERAQLQLQFSQYPGHREVPLDLTTSLDNVCELRVRKPPHRNFAYGGLTIGGMGVITAALLATSSHHDTRAPAPYIAGSGALLMVASIVYLLLPHGEGDVRVKNACSE